MSEIVTGFRDTVARWTGLRPQTGSYSAGPVPDSFTRVGAEACEPPIAAPQPDPVVDILVQICDQLDELGRLAQALVDAQHRTNEYLRRAVDRAGL